MITFEEFAELVKQMRTAQRAYFQTRSTNWLENARDLEKKVDEALRELDSRQVDLF